MYTGLLYNTSCFLYEMSQFYLGDMLPALKGCYLKIVAHELKHFNEKSEKDYKCIYMIYEIF